jgi:O-antigen/teichoic acid export membrane protein
VNGPATKPRSLQARIVSGSVILLSGSSLATGVNLAYNVAVARFLGPQGYGHASAVYTLLTLISALTLSFQIISAKIIARQDSEENKAAVYRDLHRSAWWCGLVVACLLFVFQQGIAGYLNLPSPLLVVLLAVGAAFYVPLGTRRGFIQGAYGFRNLATNLVLEGVVRLVGSVLAILLGFGVTGVIAANAAAMAVSYFAIAPRLVGKIANPIHFRDAFREVGQAIVFFSGQVLINNCDIVLVKHFFVSQEAGMYAAIAMVGRVIFAFSSAVVNSMLPVVAGTRAEDRKNLSMISTSLLLVFSIGAVLAVALRFTPAWVWTIFFGAGFQLPGHFGFPYLLALYAITTVIYSLSVVVITYEMAYKIASTSWLQLVFSGLVIASICKFHSSLQQVIMVQLILMSAMLLAVGIPFLLIARRNSATAEPTSPRSITLIRPVSEDEVIAEFLKGDFEHVAYQDHHEPLREIVFAPDLTDKCESGVRRAMLFMRHRSLWNELPSDTRWYEVEVEQSDLERISVFPRAHWRRIARGSFAITRVIDRIQSVRSEQSRRGPFSVKIDAIRERITREHSLPGSVLLIGQNPEERFTILDGNHRFVAAILDGKIDHLRFFCGLSPRMTRCCWYRTSFFSLSRYGLNLLSHLFSYSGSAGSDFSHVPDTSRTKATTSETVEALWQQQGPAGDGGGHHSYEAENAYR